jgi:hypothetical protein
MLTKEDIDSLRRMLADFVPPTPAQIREMERSHAVALVGMATWLPALLDHAATAERERDEAVATEKAARQAFADTMLRAESALAAERARVKVLEEALRNVLPYVYTGTKDGSDRIREEARAALDPPMPEKGRPHHEGPEIEWCTIHPRYARPCSACPREKRIGVVPAPTAPASEDVRGTFACPRCGRDTPHEHPVDYIVRPPTGPGQCMCGKPAVHIDVGPFFRTREEDECCGGEGCCAVLNTEGWTTRALAHGKEAGR